jgi:hypothetical protein
MSDDERIDAAARRAAALGYSLQYDAGRVTARNLIASKPQPLGNFAGASEAEALENAAWKLERIARGEEPWL